MMPHDVQTMRGPNAGTVDGSRRRVGAERCGFIDREGEHYCQRGSEAVSN
jgi:hypothetical protein